MPPRILIVDDDQSLAENLSEIVVATGATTEIAGSRAAALALAAKTDFDVALVDVRLPDGDGVDLLARLKECSAFTEVVLITGNATLKGAIAAVHGGAFAYVLKPFAPADLLETVRRALTQASLYRERERLLGELERSEKRHRDVIEAVPTFVLALDAGGRITIWNRWLEEQTGFARSEMLGKPGAQLIDSTDQPTPLTVKEGPTRLVRWRRAETRAADGQAITYAVGMDVTEEQEMLRRTLRAERLAAVGTMAAGLAHEVRNPLNSALLQLTVLERRLERGNTARESTLPVLQLVKDEIHRLDRLVRDFLAFSQPQPPEKQLVDINELLRAIIALVTPEAEAGRVEVTVELDEASPTVMGDSERLRQVLLNLIRNAGEAMPDGGRLTLRSRAEEGSGVVEIDVEDSGHGFQEQLPVFDAFFTTKSQGTGLGLAIVHRIVTDHSGTIRVRSAPGSTVFTIALPAAPPPR